jgi:hypothetical protein
MRKILVSAILALILAGGVMTFTVSITSVQAHPHHVHCFGGESPHDGDCRFLRSHGFQHRWPKHWAVFQ